MRNTGFMLSICRGQHFNGRFNEPPWKDPSIRVNVFDDMNGIPDKLLDIEDAQDVQYASPAAPSGNKLKFENGRLVLYASNNVWSDFRLNYGSAISDCTGAQGNDDTRRI